MKDTEWLTGLVLRVMPIGEYDRRIVLLTRERGKVTAFVHGARRSRSALQAASDLFCFGRFEATARKDAYNISRAEIIHSFRELSLDLDRTYYGCYFLELADYLCPEGADCTEQLKLLYQSLKALSAPSLSHRLVRTVYEFKSLVCYGVTPQVFTCVNCGSEEHLRWFSFRRRGMICGNCGEESGSIAMDDSAIYAMQFIAATPIQKLYTFTLMDEVLDNLTEVVRRYLGLYVEKEFKTLSFLEEK